MGSLESDTTERLHFHFSIVKKKKFVDLGTEDEMVGWHLRYNVLGGLQALVMDREA